MGVRFACAIDALPGAVLMAPVIEMAACLCIDSRQLVILIGPE
jgi:hypothetical protein